MRTKLQVTVTDDDGNLNVYWTPAQPDYFKQIQTWDANGLVVIDRKNDQLILPWRRVVHIKVPHE